MAMLTSLLGRRMRWFSVSRRAVAAFLLFNLVCFLALSALTGFNTAPDTENLLGPQDAPLPRAPGVDGAGLESLLGDLSPRIRLSFTPKPPPAPCPAAPPPFDLPDGHWTGVAGAGKNVFIFSAFYDMRYSPRCVKLVGMTSGRLEGARPAPLYCQLWYGTESTPHVVRAAHDLIPETHDKKYAPSFHVCRVSRPEVPRAVSLVSGDSCRQPLNYLRVIAPPGDWNTKPLPGFTVCVSPLNFHLDAVEHFVENIEYNRMFGANRYVFYNHTTGPRLDAYLKHYIKKGVVDVIPWGIPVQTEVSPPDPTIESEIHYFAQVVAINDCLYRYMYRTKYLVYLDLDEIIVPQQGHTWINLLTVALQQRTRDPLPPAIIGSFQLRNVFFRIDWPDDPDMSKNKEIVQLKLRTQLKIVREKKVWMEYMRTKYVCVPRAVEMAGIHYPFRFIDDMKVQSLHVAPEVALLHHYRDWGYESPPPERLRDVILVGQQSQLITRVRNIHQQVGIL